MEHRDFSAPVSCLWCGTFSPYAICFGPASECRRARERALHWPEFRVCVRPILFNHHWLIYCSYVLVRRGTEHGRGCGSRRHSDTLRRSHFRRRNGGVAGSFLSLVYLRTWEDGMIAGRGWIALVVVIPLVGDRSGSCREPIFRLHHRLASSDHRRGLSTCLELSVADVSLHFSGHRACLDKSTPWTPHERASGLDAALYSRGAPLM
jgi:hypothetical protein